MAKNTVYGALRLVLESRQADFQFVGQGGTTWDSGTVACRTGDVSAPGAPTNFTATPVAGAKVTLTWAASTGTPSGYQIYRNGTRLLAAGGDPTTGYLGTATTYTDSGLTPGQTYQYKVRARDAAGNESPFTATLSVTAVR
jgi:hypothetical protein